MDRYETIDATHASEGFPVSKARGEWQGPFEFPCMGACSRAASAFAKVREGGFCSEAHHGGSQLMMHKTAACANVSRAACESECLGKPMCTGLTMLATVHIIVD